MFTHVLVGANDLQKTKEFYDAIMHVLGYDAGVFDDKDHCFYMTESGVFGFGTPINGEPACLANGSTIGFAATDQATIDAWHAEGIANGGTACEDPPGLRDGGDMKYYAAYLRDPTGNKICALHQVV